MTLIEFELDIAPYQPTEQKAVNGVPTYQVSHTNDPVATGEQMQDATKYEINKYWNPTTNPIMPHMVKTFGPEINKLLKK